MSYYFIENKYPERDPNIDLNFDNDILYGAIFNDELDKYNTPYAINPDDVPYKSKKKHSIKAKKKDQSSSKVYVIFIVIIIAIIMLWYIYGGTVSEPKKQSVIDTYADKPELTMLSPDFGMASRYENTH
jgi:hypothetical protein